MNKFRRRPAEAGFADVTKLPKGPRGFNLCRRCGVECASSRRTFCGDVCVHEWKIHTQADYAKQQVFKRDNGICQGCGLDTVQDLRGTRWLNARRARGRWAMDHIIPVCEGGGSCGLENLRTLCHPCHKVETTKLAGRRAFRRRAHKWFATKG